MVIAGHVVINSNKIMRNNVSLPAPAAGETLTPELLYTSLQCNYPKFYKMDKLCKWATVAAHYLFSADNFLSTIEKSKVAIALTTAHGCLDVDKRYFDSMAVPSPALFVYTLPNIMLGELCIRYGIKGEQLCTVSDSFDAQEIFFNAKSLMDQGMHACLTGWVDVAQDTPNIHLFWITKEGKETPCTAATMQQLYNTSSK